MKSGWQQKQLGELAELKGRIGWRGLTAKEYTKSGPLFLSVHSLNYGDIVDFRDAFHISKERYEESPEIMLRKDDVLICKDGAGTGKVGIVGKLQDKRGYIKDCVNGHRRDDNRRTDGNRSETYRQAAGRL
jgi:type I restriction enzyme S subunit